MTTQTQQPNKSIAANAGTMGAGAAASGTAGNGVVESLLQEFDAQSGSQPAPQPTLSPELAPVIEFAKAEMQSKAAARYDADVKEAVSFLKQADEAKDLPDRVALGFLHALANENEEFAKAWKDRADRPGAWKDALTKAGQEWQEEVVKKLPTSRVRTEVERAAAAVHGQTNTPARAGQKSVQELARMSLRELDDYGNQLDAGRG
jgi:hypothetical protein